MLKGFNGTHVEKENTTMQDIFINKTFQSFHHQNVNTFVYFLSFKFFFCILQLSSDIFFVKKKRENIDVGGHHRRARAHTH